MSIMFHSVVFDCADAASLAGFWARVLDQPVDDGASGDYATIGMTAAPAGGPGWTFVGVPEAKGAKNRVHVDLGAHDLEAEVSRVLELGATQLAKYEEDGARWVTLADPEGNELDLVAVRS
ncbi:MAG: glyoxalase/bleomycin resistance/dioxygenase family protein [Pseudonocardiales bacterium]|nr:MAG: glyoxalase/bleomycin resistance/dioxygenase family protein [Pseudonocardiales bacterium]